MNWQALFDGTLEAIHSTEIKAYSIVSVLAVYSSDNYGCYFHWMFQ
jgi:hypothetical protein